MQGRSWCVQRDKGEHLHGSSSSQLKRLPHSKTHAALSTMAMRGPASAAQIRVQQIHHATHLYRELLIELEHRSEVIEDVAFVIE